jgi:outer membrane cobalamin receptor
LKSIDKKNVPVTIITGILIMLCCGCLNAQYSDTVKFRTDEIRVFGNKIATSNFDSPGMVQFITKSEMEHKNGETLGDVLQLGGGVYIKSYGGNFSLSTVSMNGLGAEHTLILLNGFKLNSTQNNLVDLNTFTKNNIESIEILNNGSSSIYGSEAMGGVVNIITKKNTVSDTKLSLTGQIGSFGQNYFSAAAEKRLSKFNVNLSYSKETSLNSYEYYFDNGVESILKERANSSYDYSNYSANISYYPGEKSSIRYFGNYSDQSRHIPGLETGSSPSNAVQFDRLWNNIITYENTMTESTTLSSQLNFQNNLSNYADAGLINSYYKNIFVSGTSQLNYANDNFDLAGGIQLNYSALESNETVSGIDRIQPGVFSVIKFSPSEFLNIYPSVRYDYFSDMAKSVYSGNFGVNIKPIRHTKFNLKASIGNNFAAPTFNELYWKELGNSNLLPESSLNTSVGLIYGFSLISDNSIEINYSHIDADSKIVWSPNPGGQWSPKNIGKSESNVFLINADFRKQFGSNLSAGLNINYSYTSSLKKSMDYDNDPSYGKQIFYIPEELGKSNLTVLYKKSGINIFYTFTGKRYTDFENTRFLRAVDYLEGSIFQKFKLVDIETLLRFEVNNISNADYQIIAGYPMPLRSYKLSLTLEY